MKVHNVKPTVQANFIFFLNTTNQEMWKVKLFLPYCCDIQQEYLKEEDSLGHMGIDRMIVLKQM